MSKYILILLAILTVGCADKKNGAQKNSNCIFNEFSEDEINRLTNSMNKLNEIEWELNTYIYFEGDRFNGKSVTMEESYLITKTMIESLGMERSKKILLSETYISFFEYVRAYASLERTIDEKQIAECDFQKELND